MDILNMDVVYEIFKLATFYEVYSFRQVSKRYKYIVDSRQESIDSHFSTIRCSQNIPSSHGSPNAQTCVESVLPNGIRHGRCDIKYSTGLVSSTMYKRGVPIGAYKEVRITLGVTCIEIGTYINGVKEGLYVIKSSSKTICQGLYKNGVSVKSLIYFWCNHTIAFRLYVQNSAPAVMHCVPEEHLDYQKRFNIPFIEMSNMNTRNVTEKLYKKNAESAMSEFRVSDYSGTTKYKLFKGDLYLRVFTPFSMKFVETSYVRGNSLYYTERRLPSGDLINFQCYSFGVAINRVNIFVLNKIAMCRNAYRSLDWKERSAHYINCPRDGLDPQPLFVPTTMTNFRSLTLKRIRETPEYRDLVGVPNKRRIKKQRLIEEIEARNSI